MGVARKIVSSESTKSIVEPVPSKTFQDGFLVSDTEEETSTRGTNIRNYLFMITR
jgi:hypothetical protein